MQHGSLGCGVELMATARYLRLSILGLRVAMTTVLRAHT